MNSSTESSGTSTTSQKREASTHGERVIAAP